MTNETPIRGTTRPATIRRSEEGYALLVAVFLTVLLILGLSVAAPVVARSIQRDRDLETWHRGMQYRRAIQLYYRKFRAYPPNLNALVNTNDIRFLRKKYTDPITGQADWKPVMFGQNKTPTAMGFFGQPLAGNASTLAGIGPSGGGTGLTGSSSTGGSAFGSSTFGGSTAGGSIFSSSDSGNPATSTGAGGSGSGSTDSSTSSSGASGSSIGAGSAGSSSSSSSSSGQTFGGAGIIGFSPASPKQSILIYKKKNHYSEWEFTYDPLSDQRMMSGGNTGTLNQQSSNPLTQQTQQSPSGNPVQ